MRQYMTLNEIDDQILDCNKCENNVEKFDTCRTVSVGTNNSIVIVGESPANNGWIGRIAEMESGLRRFKIWPSPAARIQPPKS